jgi:hypothetical protein
MNEETFNIQRPMVLRTNAPDSLVVQRWMLNVECFPLAMPPDENRNFIHAHLGVV